MSDTEYITKDSGARDEFDSGARRDVQTGKPRYDLIPTHALKRVADLYSRGAEKYGDNNWQKGIPFSRCLSPLERHLNQFKQGDTDEDHLAAVVWNALAIMHYQEVGPSGLDDLPKYGPSQKPDSLDLRSGVSAMQTPHPNNVEEIAPKGYGIRRGP